MAVGGGGRAARSGVLRLAAAVAGACATLVAGASGQEPGGSLTRAVMEVDATGPGLGVEVRLTYGVRVPAGAVRIPLTVLSPEPAVVENVVADGSRGPLAVDLPASATAQQSGWLALAPADTARELDVTLAYRVSEASSVSGDRVRTVAPLVVVDWPPADALPGTFRARVSLPAGATPYETFPTVHAGLARAAAEPGPLELELSVLPAYVTVRWSTSNAPVLTLPRVADAGTLLLLGLLGVVGYRKLRERM